MKAGLRKLCSPILAPFERGEGPYVYRASHRTILIVVGALFLLLALVSLYFATLAEELGAAIPIIIFLGTGLVCAVVGCLGSDKAVAKVWGSR